MGEWISVKDRLPEKMQYVHASEDVILFDDYRGQMWIGYYDHDIREFLSADGYPLSAVTHWMPLPESPKED